MNVLQGSVLGPFFFLLHINDLGNIIVEGKTHITLFCRWCFSRNNYILENLMTFSTGLILDWGAINTKIQFITFHWRQRWVTDLWLYSSTKEMYHAPKSDFSMEKTLWTPFCKIEFSGVCFPELKPCFNKETINICLRFVWG